MYTVYIEYDRIDHNNNTFDANLGTTVEIEATGSKEAIQLASEQFKQEMLDKHILIDIQWAGVLGLLRDVDEEDVL